MELPQERCRLKITERALKEAQTYARLLDEHVGPYECIGFLLGDADSDVVDKVLLAPSQRVTPTSVIIDGHSVLAAGREIERLGKRARGWWHSHGRLSTFHSGVDDANTRDVLAQIASSNRTYLEEELLPQATNGDGTILFTDGHEVIEISVNDQERAERLLGAQINVRRKVPLGLAYSLVVNARGDEPYAELHTRWWCPTCEVERVEKRAVAIEVIPALDEERMIEEIKAKVLPPHRAFSFKGGREETRPKGQKETPAVSRPGSPGLLGSVRHLAPWGRFATLLFVLAFLPVAQGLHRFGHLWQAARFRPFTPNTATAAPPRVGFWSLYQSRKASFP